MADKPGRGINDPRLLRNGGKLVIAGAAFIGFLGLWEDGAKPQYRVYADRLAHGLPTGCYGVTKFTSSKPVIVGDIWSEEDCQRVIANVSGKTQYSILDCVTYPGLTQGTLDALSSLGHNVGVSAACGSRAVGLINQGRLAEGCYAIAWTQAGTPNWSIAAGKFIQGLHNRRRAEADLCVK